LEKYARNKLLFKESFHKIEKAKVLLLGIGGVGSFCLDALWRSGLTDITIVDFDCYDITNQNRQIGSEAIGAPKVFRLASLYSGATPIMVKITPEWVKEFDFTPYDLVLDAIDDVRAKVALAHKCHKKLISSMGSAKRLDPTKIEVKSIWKVEGDPFARKIKTELKKLPIKVDYKAICSTEPAQIKEKGSFVGVTGAFGLTLSSVAIKKLIQQNTI
jgi:tRNA A37 threonylcarbamoyladenosine dehydratase